MKYIQRIWRNLRVLLIEIFQTLIVKVKNMKYNKMINLYCFVNNITWTGDLMVCLTSISNEMETFPGKVKLLGETFQLLTVTADWAGLHICASVRFNYFSS